MAGNRRHRIWKNPFHRSSPKSEPRPTPKEFICPISGSLMADPVVVASGETFERVSVQACRALDFSWVLEDGSKPDFSTVIPNLALKSTITAWCDQEKLEHPKPPDSSSVEKIVRSKMGSSRQYSNPHIRFSELELLKGVAENPHHVLFSHAATELGPRVNHFYSSSSEESVIVGASPPTPLPLATRPLCYSSSSSSSEITENDKASTPEEDEFLKKLKSNEIFDQEEGVISLRKVTRSSEKIRVSLCTSRILTAIKDLIKSRYPVVQTNAVAAVVNLSLEKSNKLKIVRAGIVPHLVDVLTGGFEESQEHAAGALFSLALDDENKMAIGVLGALQPLMYALGSDAFGERTRNDSALALYHLTLVQSNRVKLVKLAAVPKLISLVKSSSLAGRVLLVICNLAVSAEGRSALLDGNAVGCLVGMLRTNEFDSESTRENCVAALYALSHGSLRFKGLAKEAGAVEVLKEIEERGSQRAREKAKRILLMMKGGEDEEEEGEVGWEGMLESGGRNRSRNRVGVKSLYGNGTNTTNF